MAMHEVHVALITCLALLLYYSRKCNFRHLQPLTSSADAVSPKHGAGTLPIAADDYE